MKEYYDHKNCVRSFKKTGDQIYVGELYIYLLPLRTLDHRVASILDFTPWAPKLDVTPKWLTNSMKSLRLPQSLVLSPPTRRRLSRRGGWCGSWTNEYCPLLASYTCLPVSPAVCHSKKSPDPLQTSIVRTWAMHGCKGYHRISLGATRVASYLTGSILYSSSHM